MKTALLRTADFGNVSIFGTDTAQVFAWKHDEDIGPVLPPSMEPIRVRAGSRDYYRRKIRELPHVRFRSEDEPPSYESLVVDTIRIELRQWGVRYRITSPIRREFDRHLFVIVTVGWDEDAGAWVVADPLPHHERREYVIETAPTYR